MDSFEEFLRFAGPTIDYCTPANEPVVRMVPDDLISQGGRDIRAVEWFKALAERAHKVIKSDAGLSVRFAPDIQATGDFFTWPHSADQSFCRPQS